MMLNVFSRGLLVTALFLPGLSEATILQLTSPSQITGSATTLNDDVYSDGTVANNLFRSQGVTLSRVDGLPVVVFNWAYYHRATSSPPNVIATTGPPWSTSLNFTFSKPVTELGMYFGNDQGYGFTQEMLNVFDKNNVSLGSVVVPTNNNTSVDQFIGLRSTVPFYSAQIVNEGTKYLAVVVDNVEFSTTTPEPSTLVLVGSGALGFMKLMRTKTKKLAQ